jgi:hypothetical protein
MGEITERAAVRRLHDRFGFGAKPGALEVGFETTAARLFSTAPEPGVAAPVLPVLEKALPSG